eukprot:TRINITY_DN44708_c0_g1_i1.p1 TRINITY_DN44708_c0_g1~~TRINITY_DN44708_c0_g1_i1.p1  ORF type:complete len:447 (+),score=53.80 TRINITY_DN44708_c0_g1_i1:57-1397(+)
MQAGRSPNSTDPHDHMVAKQELLDSAWPLLVAELDVLHQRGLSFTKLWPPTLARAFAAAENMPSGLKDALVGLNIGRDAVVITIDISTPLWRHGDGAEIVSSLTATLPQGYPYVAPLESEGGDVEVVSTGNLGKDAAKIVSRAAHVKVAELRETSVASVPGNYLVGLVDWLQQLEVHELAASYFSLPRSPELGRVRAFVRFHHVAALFKRRYLRLWAEDLGIAALLAGGQPAMLLAEGPVGALRAYLSRAMKVLHWGPTPSRLVASTPMQDLEINGAALPTGLQDASELFPSTVDLEGTYNGRQSVDFVALARHLLSAGHTAAAKELRSLLDSAFAHIDGRVQEAHDGSGWIGYSVPEPALATPDMPVASAKTKPARWRKESGRGVAESAAAPPKVAIVARESLQSNAPSRPDVAVSAAPAGTNAGPRPRGRWGGYVHPAGVDSAN